MADTYVTQGNASGTWVEKPTTLTASTGGWGIGAWGSGPWGGGLGSISLTVPGPTLEVIKPSDTYVGVNNI
jgi:hypothetical protein